MPSPAYVAYCRAFQTVMRGASYLLPWRKPRILGNYAQMTQALGRRNIASVLLVTDGGLVSIGLNTELEQALTDASIACHRFDQVVPNPTIGNVEDALHLYRSQGCQAIVALGGGSPMDCAKAVAARLARPTRTVRGLGGLLKVHARIVPFVAIPTTAGTGSETTVAAVISDPVTHEKYSINDPSLIPHYALLEPRLTAGLPPHITAATGMDALSHAVEAYIGHANTRQTRQDALTATALVFDNLRQAVNHGDDLQARANMQQAAYLGGTAFTRAYVGYIHAMSHQLSGLYGTVHGVGNTMLMPHVLEAYGAAAHKPLADLAVAAGLVDHVDNSVQRVGESQAVAAVDGPEIDDGITYADAAQAFIQAIRDLAAAVNLPTTEPKLREEDIPTLTQRALKEGNPVYPVPVIFGKTEIAALYRKAMG
ncbi:MAG: iron-containing alcohol dehydrogenase [Cellulomonadaceae bacterium]|jgi:alcohol dehydrogenase class IV|nr:iron-containing alcohol dehydrogenase [Cellulomonadaceae bacterium]